MIPVDEGLAVRDVAKAIVRELRHLSRNDREQLDYDRPGFGLRRLPWGMEDRCYAWTVPPSTPDATGPDLCLKLYTDNPGRAWTEVRALQYLPEVAAIDTPKFLWHDSDRPIPATVMGLLPGAPISAIHAPTAALLESIVTVVQGVQRLPLGPLENRPRADSPLSYARGLAEQWPTQLAASRDDESRVVLKLVTSWRHDFDDTQILNRPVDEVLSPGSANLGCWLWDDQANTVHLIDWSGAGRSDLASDAADRVEHPTARRFSDEQRAEVLPALGVDATTRDRFQAAQRVAAMHWLRRRWRSRTELPLQLISQCDRVRALLTPSSV
ncbi:hypothetical protein [Kibdelosporangium phytohabitans]|nr:hypothetical protein [Kibdelosporangium phytohabitans]MBE1467567.1 hypothetical protein [Kibdelosporangium phytohabitans]